MEKKLENISKGVKKIHHTMGLIRALSMLPAGGVIFMIAFSILWWNEGRTSRSQIAQKAIPISADAYDANKEGRLVSLTGKIETNKKIGDPAFLKKGDYFFLRREVEMYAWSEIEKKENNITRSSRRRGIVITNTTVKTTYTYSKGWTSNPHDSSQFHRKTGHINPILSIKNKTFIPKKGTIGVYEISFKDLRLPNGNEILLNKTMLIHSSHRNPMILSGDLYIKKDSRKRNHIGDVRIKYYGLLQNSEITVIGKLQENEIVPYAVPIHGKKISGKEVLKKKNAMTALKFLDQNLGTTIFRAYAGGRKEAIKNLKREHNSLKWMMRFIAFMIMGCGLLILTFPLIKFFQIFPGLANIGGFTVLLGVFVLNVVIFFTTILVAIISHSLFVFSTIFLMILVGSFFIVRVAGKARQARRSTHENHHHSQENQEISQQKRASDRLNQSQHSGKSDKLNRQTQRKKGRISDKLSSPKKGKKSAISDKLNKLKRPKR